MEVRGKQKLFLAETYFLHKGNSLPFLSEIKYNSAGLASRPFSLSFTPHIHASENLHYPLFISTVTPRTGSVLTSLSTTHSTSLPDLSSKKGANLNNCLALLVVQDALSFLSLSRASSEFCRCPQPSVEQKTPRSRSFNWGVY